MFFVYVRIVAKLMLFFFGTFFIIFFIVYGYRYNKNVGFMQQNVYVDFTFWQKKSTIGFGGKVYFTENQQLQLYNMEPGCYSINYDGENYTKCLKNDESYSDVFVKAKGKYYIGYNLDIDCESYDSVPFDNYKVGNRYFSQELKNAFAYNNINFVQTEDDIFFCNRDYSICKYLADVPGEVMCGNEQGLVYFDQGYHLLEMK